MNTYKVVVTREGDAWLADVPDVPGAHTFARSLAALDSAVREVIVLMDDLDDDASVAISYSYEIDDPTVTEAATIGADRMSVANREAELVAATAHMARELTRCGYSVRDAAHLLGITAGRVSQLSKP